MNLNAVRRVFGSLLRGERGELPARFLSVILLSGLIIDVVIIIPRILEGATPFTSTTLNILIVLVILQGILLLMVRQGYVNQAALSLVVLAWITITYQAWSADGVRDVSIYVYIVIILIAALLTNLQVSVFISVLSIFSIWILAATEASGLRALHVDSPLNIARDLTGIFVILFLVIYLMMSMVQNSLFAFRQSEARTRALLDAIPDMIFEFNRSGTILQYISSARNRPLLPPEQFLGKKIIDVLPASVANQTMFAIERVLDSGHVHAFEYQLLQDDENKTFEARLTPLRTDAVLAIVRDVSLQRWILGEREKLITELELKNAELERFTYTASHDLKSPLITIKGFLGFLREDAQKGNLKRLESDIQRIGDAADKMQQLLNDLLELSRIGRMVNDSEAIDLSVMIAEVIELLHGRLSQRPIEVTVHDPLSKVYGDRARLLEVWQNLIDNAAKFMGDQPNPQIEIGELQGPQGDAPIFFVRDNGIGIDPKFNDRIFGLFDKLDSRTEGTGIGLALVKRTIEFHGGRIWVESEPGKGAAFYFTLPGGEVAPRQNQEDFPPSS